MITEQYIKHEYVSAVISRDVKKIYGIQKQVVDQYLNVRSGALIHMLTNAAFTLSGNDTTTKVVLKLLPYLRFIDILWRDGASSMLSRQMRSKVSVYNRCVWGVVYHETLPDLQYGLAEDIRQGIIDAYNEEFDKPIKMDL